MGTLRSAIAVTVLFLGFGPTAYSASFVKVAATRTRSSSLNSSIAAPIPTSGVAAGDSIIVTVHVGALAGVVTCSDTVNGAYDVDVTSPPGSAGIAIASKHNVAALGFGDEVTCSYPQFNGASSMTVYEFSGLEPVNPLDQTAQSLSATDGAASSGLTASTSQDRELVFGFVWLPSAGQTFVAATSGSNPLENPYDPPWSRPFAIGTQKTMYRFVRSIRQYEANGTVGGTGGWLAQVATYRLAPDLCENVSCDDNNDCTIDTCDPGTGLCTHAPEPVGIRCGSPFSGICDSADRCDGAGVCLANNRPDGTSCADANGDCDLEDTCLAGVCNDNGVKPEGTACGDPASTLCDAADTCDGSGFCLSNLAPDGSVCGDAGVQCVNADTCLAGLCQDNGFQAPGAACGDGSSGACDDADSCDGSGSCLSNHVADGTRCGDPSAGQCDQADACDGSGTCSPNHVATGTPCNDGDSCTISDVCDDSGLCAGSDDPVCTACSGNTAPIVAATVVADPSGPFALGTGTVTVAASFTDSPGQARTCTIDWGDGSAPDAGAVAEPTATEPGTCTGTHLYTAVGVYTVSITVTDACEESAGAVYQYAVVYDPSAGFVTGGGWIVSPPGAYVPNPALTGKAFFGFVSGYFKGNTSVPTGRTNFHFHAANFNFESSAYEWLVVSGAKARFRGTGQVNGGGSYGFALTAWDGQAPGGGGIDRFRIRIWDQNAGDAVVYDNQIVCSNQGENADPCIAVSGGSIVIHKK